MKRAISPRLKAPTADVLARLAAIVGDAHVLRDPTAQAPYLREWRDRYIGKTPAVLRPATTDETARCLAILNEAHVGVVPQAGNTGLVGGQIPSADGTEIVLSVERMRRVRTVDRTGASMIVEAGVTLSDTQTAADAADRYFPLSMASEGSCRIGGTLATNAGGVAVLAYGTARDLALGIEAVLADGRIWNGLSALKKDNTGYDLKDLLIGSEGTLGIITAAALKLFPKPAERATAFVALKSLLDVDTLFRETSATTGPMLTAFEFMSGRALDFVLKHQQGARSPFSSTYPWYALIELSAWEAGPASRQLETLLANATSNGTVADAVVAASLDQAAGLWRLREAMSEVQKAEGGSIKHDISVPISSIPDFIEKAGALVEDLCPGARPVPFGHFGDGNIHYNVSQPINMEKKTFLDLWETMQHRIHDLTIAMSGSISAEHGIGQMKRAELARLKSATDLDVMRAIKTAIDPNGILNPGKVL